VANIVKGMMIRSDCYSISDSGMVGRGHSDGCVQKFPTFQTIFDEVCVQIHESGKVGTWIGIFGLEWFLKQG
jgi:hypothetical protein